MQEHISPFAAFSKSLADLAGQAGAGVVAIHAGRRFTSSGLHWTDGHIVTSDHTIERDDDVEITLPDGSKHAASVVGRDAATDVALLHADVTLPAVGKDAGPALADFASLRPGHAVLAVARSPEDGLGTSFGVLSAVSGAWRTWQGGELEAFIQPDVRLYPGFSGGPLVDAEGRIIGLNTSGLSRHFALTIPSVSVARIVEDLRQRGSVGRPYLGLGMQAVRIPPRFQASLGAPGRGIIVLNVDPDGPSERAGVLLGDVITTFGGATVDDTETLLTHLGRTPIGTAVVLDVIRAGASLSLTVEVGERPAPGGNHACERRPT